MKIRKLLSGILTGVMMLSALPVVASATEFKNESNSVEATTSSATTIIGDAGDIFHLGEYSVEFFSLDEMNSKLVQPQSLKAKGDIISAQTYSGLGRYIEFSTTAGIGLKYVQAIISNQSWDTVSAYLLTSTHEKKDQEIKIKSGLGAVLVAQRPNEESNDYILQLTPTNLNSLNVIVTVRHSELWY